MFRDGSRLEKIGNRCFSGSGIEKIMIPSSVTTINENTFSHCEDLKNILFQEDSRLERIKAQCFSESGIEEIVLPSEL